MNSTETAEMQTVGDQGNVPCIPTGHYRFIFKCASSPPAQEYLGSAWRGALGHALRRTVCVTRQPDCKTCLLYRSCSFPYFFDTPPPIKSRKMRRYTTTPHPFVLVLPPAGMDMDETGNALLELVLIGKTANRQLAYLTHALKQAGDQGLTSARLQMELLQVEQAVTIPPRQYQSIYQADEESLEPLPVMIPACPSLPARVNIGFQTPFRFKRGGRLVTPESFCFADLFGAVLRRISMLSYFHTDEPFEPDFRRLTELARDVKIHSNRLRWHDWTRYSGRQHTAMQMGGVIGEIEIREPEMAHFWPCLWLGQWLHAGKATSMGLGRYRINAAASLPEQVQVKD